MSNRQTPQFASRRAAGEVERSGMLTEAGARKALREIAAAAGGPFIVVRSMSRSLTHLCMVGGAEFAVSTLTALEKRGLLRKIKDKPRVYVAEEMPR